MASTEVPVQDIVRPISRCSHQTHHPPEMNLDQFMSAKLRVRVLHAPSEYGSDARVLVGLEMLAETLPEYGRSHITAHRVSPHAVS